LNWPQLSTIQIPLLTTPVVNRGPHPLTPKRRSVLPWAELPVNPMTVLKACAAYISVENEAFDGIVDAVGALISKEA
jgi:hypothetical protein